MKAVLLLLMMLLVTDLSFAQFTPPLLLWEQFKEIDRQKQQSPLQERVKWDNVIIKARQRYVSEKMVLDQENARKRELKARTEPTNSLTTTGKPKYVGQQGPHSWSGKWANNGHDCPKLMDEILNKDYKQPDKINVAYDKCKAAYECHVDNDNRFDDKISNRLYKAWQEACNHYDKILRTYPGAYSPRSGRRR